jgi:hypothetical protein
MVASKPNPYSPFLHSCEICGRVPCEDRGTFRWSVGVRTASKHPNCKGRLGLPRPASKRTGRHVFPPNCSTIATMLLTSVSPVVSRFPHSVHQRGHVQRGEPRPAAREECSEDDPGDVGRMKRQNTGRHHLAQSRRHALIPKRHCRGIYRQFLLQSSGRHEAAGKTAGNSL